MPNLKKIITLVTFLVIPLSQIFSVSIQHTPVRSAIPKNPIQVEFFATQMNKITFATLVARTSRTTNYVRLPMTGSGRLYKGEIPSYLVQKVGVEYYLEAVTTDGKTISYPSSSPQSNPVKVNMTEASVSPVIRIIAPLPEKIVSNKRPTVSVSFKNFINPVDVSSVQIFLDGTNVSTNAIIKETFAQYRPPIALSKGEHKLKVFVKDISGAGATPQEWIFYIQTKGLKSTSKKKEEKVWKTNGNINANYQWAKMDSNGGENNVANPNGSSTATIDFKATNETSEITLGPLFFTTIETSDQQPAENFTFAYKNSFLETKWGSVSSQLTAMSGGGGAIHGGEIVMYSQNKKDKEGFRFQVAGGRTRQVVKASEATFGVGTYSQRIFSGKVDYFASKKLEIYSAVMDVRDIENSLDVKDRGDVEPLENQAGAIGFKGKIPIFLLDNWEGEVGYSFAKIKNPEDTSLVDNFQDFAFKFAGTKNLTAIKSNLKINYDHYRPNFLFLFGGSGSDSQNVGINLSNTLFTAFKPTISYKWQTDNLENQKEATTQNHQFSLTTNLNIPKIPTISISGSAALQTSVPLDTLKESLKSENKNYTANISTSFSYKVFAISMSTPFAFSFNRSESISGGNPEGTISQAYSPSSGIKMTNLFGFLSVDFTASLNATPDATTNANASINGAWGLSDNFSLNLTPTFSGIGISIPIGFTISRNYEFQSTKEKADTDNQTFGINVSFAYALFKIHKLNLSFAFNKSTDEIKPDSGYKQYSVTVGYNYTF